MTDYTELVDELYYAQELIAEAASICRRVAEQTESHYVLCTLVANLEILVETGDWLSFDMTIPQWIAKLKAGKEEDTV